MSALSARIILTTTKGTTPMANMKKIMDATNDALHTDEISDEASGLVATIMEGLPLDVIVRELYEYSQALSAMVLTKILHTMYDSETIDKMMDGYQDELTAEMFDEIENYLKKEGN
jgi:hypothetical protein